jgi:transcriptional regulator of acetoin/glycerol metabolism
MGRLQQVIDEAAKNEITSTLQTAGGNMAEAARRLGVSYQGLWKRLRSLGIEPHSFRP